MLRLRLAALTVASGLLVTLSGCASTCNEPMFSRLRSVFTSRSAPSAVTDCDCCHSAPAAPYMTVPLPSQAPTFVGPPPITTVPSSLQPGVIRVPEATTVPYSPMLK